MDLATLVGILTALVGALGIKEIWSIIKKKVDHHNQKENSNEEKIDDLIEKNKQCAIKLARLEERIMLSANKSSTRKRKKSTTKEK